MGYQPGKGLGKNLQGRPEIVKVYQRKGKGAVGAYGHEGQETQIDEMKDPTSKAKKEVRNKPNFSSVKAKKSKFPKRNGCKPSDTWRQNTRVTKIWTRSKTKFLFKADQPRSPHVTIRDVKSPHQDNIKSTNDKVVTPKRRDLPPQRRKESAYGSLLECNTCSKSFDTIEERKKHELKC